MENELEYLNVVDYQRETNQPYRLEELYLEEWEVDAPELNGSMPVTATDEIVDF